MRHIWKVDVTHELQQVQLELLVKSQKDTWRPTLLIISHDILQTGIILFYAHLVVYCNVLGKVSSVLVHLLRRRCTDKPYGQTDGLCMQRWVGGGEVKKNNIKILHKTLQKLSSYEIWGIVYVMCISEFQGMKRIR